MVHGELLPEVAELGLLAHVLGEPARDVLLGAGLCLRGVVLMRGALLANLRGFRRVRARVRDRAQVDNAVEARVVEPPAPVQVAEDAHVVGAVREQRVPPALLRELDGLQAAAGLDGDLVVLAEEVESEGVRGPEEPEAGRLEDVGGLEEPGGGRLRREAQRRVQERDVEAHAVEGAERVGGVEGLDELRAQPRLALRLARAHAPELVRAALARVVVLRADDGHDAVRGVQPRRLDVEGEHARGGARGASGILFFLLPLRKSIMV